MSHALAGQFIQPYLGGYLLLLAGNYRYLCPIKVCGRKGMRPSLIALYLKDRLNLTEVKQDIWCLVGYSC